MGRFYYAPLDALSVAAVCELWAIKSASNMVTRIHEVSVTQDTSETSEQLPLMIFRTATDQSAKGSACTPNPVNPGDAAYSGTVRTNILTAETFATESTPLWRDSENVLAGWHFLPKDQGIIEIKGGALAVVKLDAAPSSSIPISGYMLIEEIG